MGEPSPESTCNRILLVDDEQLIANALAHMLRTAGYAIDLARNGQEALAKVSSADYDLIICDVKMPVMDGKAFYRELRSSRPGFCQRIVFCTGDMDNPTTRRFLKASGVPFICKPFRLGAVLKMVSLRLAGDRYMAQPMPSM
jgi:CheY-like chemotaxis protein